MFVRENIAYKRTEFPSNNSLYRRLTTVSSAGNSLNGRVLHLQRTIGNQAVQRLFKSGILQAKLRIGQPNDIYEQEADRVAEQVMNMPKPAIQSKPT